MVAGGGRFRRAARSLRAKSDGELAAMFGSRVDLPAAFGAPKRRRLFFPLTGLLAVPRAGALG